MAISQVIDYFNMGNFPHVNILKTKQYVQLMPFCMFYRKHSCLLRPFNEQINLYSSSGLIDSWARGFKKPHYFKNSPMEPKALSFNQINGLIAVCILFIAFSIIVFILELMSTSHEVIKSMLDFFAFSTKQKHKFHIIRSTEQSKLIEL